VRVKVPSWTPGFYSPCRGSFPGPFRGLPVSRRNLRKPTSMACLGFWVLLALFAVAAPRGWNDQASSHGVDFRPFMPIYLWGCSRGYRFSGGKALLGSGSLWLRTSQLRCCLCPQFCRFGLSCLQDSARGLNLSIPFRLF
jgi:hypothetical protein